MVFGLRSYNTSGYVQIDEYYANYVPVTSGYTVIQDATATISGAISIGPVIGVPNYGIMPMVFIQNVSGYPVALHSVGVNYIRFAKEYTGTPFDVGFNWMVAYPASVVVGPQPGFGLEVYAPGGPLAFSSDVGYTRVQDVLQIPALGWGGTAAMSAYHPNPWLLVSNTFGQRYLGDETFQLGYTYFLGLRCNGGTQVVATMMIEQGGMGYSPTAADTIATIAVLKN